MQEHMINLGIYRFFRMPTLRCYNPSYPTSRTWKLDSEQSSPKAPLQAMTSFLWFLFLMLLLPWSLSPYT